MKISRLKSSEGFTIVELMIALSVLSVILVIATVVMIQISNFYTKGVNASTLQNATRTINADLTSSLEFSGTTPDGCTLFKFDGTAPSTGQPAVTCAATAIDNPTLHSKVYAYCIGDTRYSFVMNRELGDDGGTGSPIPLHTPHVLWRDTKTTTACKPVDLSKSASDLNDTSGPAPGSKGDGYEMAPVHTRLTKFLINAVNSDTYDVHISLAYGDSDLVVVDNSGHAICRGGSGTQFCSAADINTRVMRRIASSN